MELVGVGQALKRLEGLSSKILDAASSPVRLAILKLLSSRGPLPYTEIMFAVNLDPVRDAGKFVYHLRSLVDAGLIRLDRKSKKYLSTELGEMVVKFSRDLEEYLAVKKGKMYVRTSRLAIEEFDRSRIVDSLVREAGVPVELAQEIAAEAEERLIKLKARYLTAPLIREFVNALLLERGLEEYRHKLTRLGMPIYDVTQTVEEAARKGLPVSTVERAAGSSVLKEYVLLKGVSRSVADAHLSGLIHLDSTENWLLKPDYASHDPRMILNPPRGGEPPQDLGDALNLIIRVHRRTVGEVSQGEILPFLNVFLAPYLMDMDHAQAGRLIQRFLCELNEEASINPYTPRLSIGVSPRIPGELEDEEAASPKGRSSSYGDFRDEAAAAASLIIEAADKLSRRTPLLNPLLTVKLEDMDGMGTLYVLEAEHGSIYLDFTPGCEASYSGDGIRLSPGWRGDWRVDVVRTGHAGTVFLNLARMAYESKENYERFKRLLDDTVQLAVEALKAKEDSLKNRLDMGLLPGLNGLGFSPEGMQHGIGVLGLSEASMIHTGSPIGLGDEAVEFAVETLKHLGEASSALSKETGLRINVVQKPCEDGSPRLARLDVESYGKGAVKFQGLPGNPYYADIPLIPPSLDIPLEARGRLEGTLQEHLRGGHLALFHVSEADPEALRVFSLKLREMGVLFATFAMELSQCNSCHRPSKGLIQICPSCGSSSISHYGAASALLQPLKLWPPSKAKTFNEWIRYTIK
ncbi:MAG: anaerobic ribonucleoside-triphosphate reductase [Candidatus Bathyarchaeia archaeon]